MELHANGAASSVRWQVLQPVCYQTFRESDWTGVKNFVSDCGLNHFSPSDARVVRAASRIVATNTFVNT